MATGLMLAFPSDFFFFNYLFNPVGSFLTGVSGVPFVLALHRFASELLVVLVAIHIYAGFVFKTFIVSDYWKKRGAHYLAGSHFRRGNDCGYLFLRGLRKAIRCNLNHAVFRSAADRVKMFTSEVDCEVS